MSAQGQPCVYEDESLTQLVTVEDDFGNPDDESEIDGDAGDTKYKYLWIAPERGFLAADIDDTVQVLTLQAARFANPALNVVVIGAEKILVGAGFGTTNLSGLTRGYDGTSRASHTADDPVILCYDITAAKIVARDKKDTDEAGWMTYCLAPGGVPDNIYNSHPTELALGNIAYNGKVQVRRRLIVPAGTSPRAKTDLLHDTNGKLTEHEF